MAKASVFAPVILSLFAVILQDVSGQDLWDSSDKIKIEASNILDQIKEGRDVYCGPGSVIIGDVLFENITNKSIESNISISSDIYGEVRACKEFKGLVNFNDATFHKDAIFENSNFSGAVILDGASFKGILNLEGAYFYNISSFQKIKCEEKASFYRAIFAGSSYFYDSIFSKLADFSRCTFENSSEFQDATFQGRAFFRGSTFRKQANFKGSDFAKDAEFSGANFKSDVIIASVKCEGIMNFNKYGFLKPIKTKINRNLSLQESWIKHIDLRDALLSNRSLLFLNNCDFYRMDARWADIQDHILFDEQVYIKLINNYKSVGMFADADACYREYSYKSKKPDISSKIISCILWITCDYGTDATRAPILLVIISLIFAALYRWPAPHIRDKRNEAKEAKKEDKPISIWNSIYFSAMVLVNSSTDCVPKGLWRWAVLIERLIGWGLLAIFIITIVRLGLR